MEQNEQNVDHRQANNQSVKIFMVAILPFIDCYSSKGENDYSIRQQSQEPKCVQCDRFNHKSDFD